MAVPIESIVPGAVFLIGKHMRQVIRVESGSDRCSHHKYVIWEYADGGRRGPKPGGGSQWLPGFASKAKPVTDPKPTYAELEAKLAAMNESPTIIADLDVEIKRVIVMAHAVHRSPTSENLERLGKALKSYDEKFATQRAENLLSVLADAFKTLPDDGTAGDH